MSRAWPVHAPARLLAAASLVAISAGLPAHAQSDDDLTGGLVELDAITVTATRLGEPAYGALSPSSVWTRGEFQALQPDTVTDILTLVPSVSTQTTPNDPATAVSVRGLQDFGRVNVLVDGARQNFQKSGHGANGTFYIDTEMLRAVDVTRGPSAAVYGSGAIGGVVSFTTLGADDVLDGDETVALSLKTTAGTNAPSFLVHGEAAARLSDRADIVGAATFRKAGNYEAGGGETVVSGQELASGLAKLRFEPTDAHEVTLSAMRYDSRFDNLLTEAATNRALSDTFTLAWRWMPDTALADLSAKTYYTTTQLEQRDRSTDPHRVRTYEIGTLGADVFNTSRFDLGRRRHELTYGIDAFQDRVETDDPHGTSDDLTPSGERIVYGAFVQDKIAVTDRIDLIGALRFDGYSLTGNGIRNEGTRLSPKVTVGYTPVDPVTLYATYAEGYRAPSITETMIDGFHPPPVSTGAFLPNPDLKPEIARSIEAGVNLDFDGLMRPDDRLRVKLGAFHTRVDDFIEQVFQMFPIPGGYQYRNIAEATIEGIELEANYDAGAYFLSLSGQTMRGVNTRTDEVLASVPPDRITLLAGIRPFAGDFELGTRMTAVAARRNAEAVGLVGDPYQLVDLFATWRMSPDATLAVHLGNIFDRRYTQYPNGSPDPGFNARASLTVRLGG